MKGSKLTLSVAAIVLAAACQLRTEGSFPEDSTTDTSPDDTTSDGPCSPGEILCEGFCIDPTTDGQHCGECNNQCDSHEQCVEGVCQCLDGLTMCSGVCVDTNTDPENCGGCGIECADTQYCCGGTCSECCGNEHCDDTIECTTDICDAGNVCLNEPIDDHTVLCAGDTGICCGGECRIGGNCCHDSDCPGGDPGECRGTATACNTLGNDVCFNQHGCGLEGHPDFYCSGTAVACDQMPTLCSDCTCEWNTETGECLGTPFDCYSLTDVWPNECSRCGCTYEGSMPPGPCGEPLDYGCHLLSCETQDGCSWSGSSTGSCSGYVCQ